MSMNIVVFASHGGSNLQAVVDAVAEGRIDADIKAVISNNSGAFALERARRAGIPAYHVSLKTEGGEAALSQKAAELMKEHKYVFVHCSSTDMERLASFKNARMYPHRFLMADEYQKDILDLFSATAGRKTSCFNFGKVYTYSSNLNDRMLKDGFTMFVRANRSSNALLSRIFPLLPAQEKPLLIYSLWGGYIDRSDTKNENYLKLQSRFTNVVRLHTGGHATAETLRDICELTNPRLAILPIHKEKEADFSSIGIPARLQEKIRTTDCKISGVNIEFHE